MIHPRTQTYMQLKQLSYKRICKLQLLLPNPPPPFTSLCKYNLFSNKKDHQFYVQSLQHPSNYSNDIQKFKLLFPSIYLVVKPSIQKRKGIDLLLKMTSSCNQRITNGQENVTTIRLTLLPTPALLFVFFFFFFFFQ